MLIIVVERVCICWPHTGRKTQKKKTRFATIDKKVYQRPTDGCVGEWTGVGKPMLQLILLLSCWGGGGGKGPCAYP